METLPMVCVLLRIQPRLNNEANNLSKLVKRLHTNTKNNQLEVNVAEQVVLVACG
jgi:hypothetical protein